MIIANQYLSLHLKYSEVRCRCGGRCDGGHLRWEAVFLFERIRAACSKVSGRDCPIRINSGVRCELHNVMVGGAKGSQHLRGTALDLATPKGLDLEAFAAVCDQENPDGGVIIYAWGCHVDARGTRCREDRRK